MRIIRIAVQGIFGYKVRNLLSVAAITLGMVGIVSVFAAQGVLKDTVARQATLQGGPTATYELSIGLASPSTGAAATVLRQLEVKSGATAGAISQTLPDIVVWQGQKPREDIAVSFTSYSLRDVRPFVMQGGSWLSSSKSLSPQVVLNRAAARALQSCGDLQIGDENFRMSGRCIGVVDDGESIPRVYLGVDDAARWHTSAASTNFLLTAPSLTADSVRTAAVNLQRLGSDFAISQISRTDTVRELADEINSTSQVLLVLGVLSLLSTVVGVANLGITTARSRAYEFSLRAIYGASRFQIAAITFVESQVVALGAAAFAVGVTYLTYPFMLQAFALASGVRRPDFPLSVLALAVIVAALTGLASSAIPAVMSSRRDISDVMRV